MSVSAPKRKRKPLPKGTVIHRFNKKNHGGRRVAVVIYRHPDEGGQHLQAPYAGTMLKPTEIKNRQQEEMLVEIFDDLLLQPYMKKDHNGRWMAT